MVNASADILVTANNFIKSNMTATNLGLAVLL